ncbi:hypothetical protein Taro_045674, partial [Colocasia esculenta]|nr:hypothetical protein [Colocasia esculenta]
GRKRSVKNVEPIEGEDDKSQNVIKTSKPSGPIASADILKAKKKDLSECYGPSIIIDRISNNKRNCSYLWSIFSVEHLKNYDCWDCLWFLYYKFNASQRKKMLTWVKDKEVFLKKYLFLPICIWGHWSLVILCHEEEDDLSFIMLLDSLHSIDPPKLVRPIQRFLKDKYATKNKTVIANAMSSIDISIPSVPQQTNGTECEFFVLYYIYHFIQNDPPSFSLDDYPSFRYSDINKKSKSHHKYFHCAGTKSFADINEEETKLQDVKITQPSSSSSSSIATVDDIYSQVFGKDRLRLVCGVVDTGPTPTSLWGTSSQCQAQLRVENAHLNSMVKELTERLGKVESIVVEPKQVESTPNMKRCVQSSASSLMLGKKVKLCEMEGHLVANAIIMSLDKSKMVMSKSLGDEYYEVELDDT